MEYDYGECATCARRGDPYCVGCQPTMASDGTFSRSLYTPHNGKICFTSQITATSVFPEREDVDGKEEK